MKIKINPFLVILASSGLIATGKADTTWDGGGTDDLWGTGANWVGDVAPSIGSNIRFAGSTRLSPDFNYTAYDNMARIYFDSGAGSFTLIGNSLKLQTNGANTPLIQNDSTSLQTVRFANIVFNNSGTINASSGDVTLNLGSGTGSIFIDNSSTITLQAAASKTVLIDNIIANGNATGNVLVSGSGNVKLARANSYSGTTGIDSGTLELGNNSALGTSIAYVGNGGTSFANTNATLVLNASGLTVSNQINTNKADTGSGLGSGTRTIGGSFTSGSSTFSSNIFLDGGAVLTAGSGGTVVFSGVIQNGAGSGNVSRAISVNASGGTVILNGANSYTGGTTIASGSTVLVGNGGTTGKLGSGALVNHGTLTYNLVGTSTVANLGSDFITGITGAGATSFTADTINFGSSGGFTATTSGSQSYTATNNATNLFKGIVVGTSGAYNYTTSGGAAITMKGDLGATAPSTATVNLDTSNGNGTINLDISIGRANQLYNIGAFTANAGTGAINWTGTYGEARVSNSNQSTPITLTGAINMSSNFQVQTTLTLTLNAAGISTVTGNLLGAINVVKGGSQNLTLSGANTYSGTTAVNLGRLIITGASNTSGTSIASGAFLELNNTTGTRDYTNTTNFTGAGTLVKTGNGAIQWGGGAATFNMSSGALIDVQAGIFIAGASANEVWTNNKADLNVGANGTFNGYEATSTANGGIFVDALTGTGTIKVGFASGYANKITFGVDNGSASFGGVLADQNPGWGNYTKTGTGTQTLTGTNTATGTMTVNNVGTLVYSATGTYGFSSHVVNTGATLEFNATSNMDRAATTFSGTGTLKKTGTGFIQWGGSATTFAFSSGALIDVQSGTFIGASNANDKWTDNKADLNVASGAVFDGAEGSSLANGGIFVNKLSGDGTIRLGYTNNGLGTDYANKFTFGVDNGTSSFGGVLENASNAVGNFIKSGTGTQTLTNTSTATGTMTINNGTLALGHATNTLADTMIVVVDGSAAILSLAGNNDSVGAVSLKNGATITSTSGTLSGASYAVESGSVSAKLGGAGGLTKSTAGIVTLSAVNSYGGNTTVKAGTLALTGTGTLGSGAAIIVGDVGSSGAILNITGISAGTYTVDSGKTLSGIGSVDATGKNLSVAGTIAPGNSPGILTVTTSALQFSSSSALNIEMTRGVSPSEGSNYDQLGVIGTIDIAAGATLNLTALSAGTWTNNDIYFLINNDSTDAITGSFTGFAEGSTITFDAQQFNVTYLANAATSSFTGGNDFALQAIPEPTVTLLSSLGLLAMLRRRRN